MACYTCILVRGKGHPKESSEALYSKGCGWIDNGGWSEDSERVLGCNRFLVVRRAEPAGKGRGGGGERPLPMTAREQRRGKPSWGPPRVAGVPT